MGSCRVKGDQICTPWLGHLGVTMSGMMGNMLWYGSLTRQHCTDVRAQLSRHAACRIVYGAATAQSLLQVSCRLPSEGDAPQSLEGVAAFSAEVRSLGHLVRKAEFTHLPPLHSRDLTSLSAGLCFVPALQWAQDHLPDQSQRAPGPVPTAGAQPGGGVPLTRPPEAFHLPGRTCPASCVPTSETAPAPQQDCLRALPHPYPYIARGFKEPRPDPFHGLRTSKCRATRWM